MTPCLEGVSSFVGSLVAVGILYIKQCRNGCVGAVGPSLVCDDFARRSFFNRDSRQIENTPGGYDRLVINNQKFEMAIYSSSIVHSATCALVHVAVPCTCTHPAHTATKTALA